MGKLGPREPSGRMKVNRRMCAPLIGVSASASTLVYTRPEMATISCWWVRGFTTVFMETHMDTRGGTGSFLEDSINTTFLGASTPTSSLAQDTLLGTIRGLRMVSQEGPMVALEEEELEAGVDAPKIFWYVLPPAHTSGLARRT